MTLAKALEEKGVNVQAAAISKWEKNITQPSVLQFFALCEALNITDVNEVFGLCVTETPYMSLSRNGKLKVLEYIDLLHRSGLYERTCKDDYEEENIQQARIYPVE